MTGEVGEVPRASISMRDRLRRLRLYYKSLGLMKRAFRNLTKVLAFPFLGSGRFVSRVDGALIKVPPDLWTMLPTAARCVLMGALPEWRQDGFHVKSGTVDIVSPADSKEAALFFREIFVDDVYGLGRYDLNDRQVIDIGAFVGDTAVAFALRGAYVHAFEPVREFREYIAANARINGVSERITVHAVGLSDRERSLSVRSPSAQVLTLVETRTYCLQAGIKDPYLMKMDCEGCEYELFSSEAFWTVLRPQHILMEFHYGGDRLAEILHRKGYAVEPYDGPQGYLFAHRTT